MPLASFHPAVRAWFTETLGEPSAPQRLGWPRIREGKHTLIAAPTGSGKTLAAFLNAIDSLLRQGRDLPDETQVLYISPLRALSNDVQKNLEVPLREISARDLFLPELRVLVRTGDTDSGARQKMARKPPHILVTTPESLYILLTSQGGRAMLRTVKTVIVDEIHALARDKRGSHLMLSLERLVGLCGEVQRIGLSATQKPLEDVGRFLVGAGREVELIDAGHLREIDLALELPPSALSTICSHETWAEIYARMVELIQQHKTTLVFANTRKLTERLAARLTELLGADLVTSHHGSLSRERRLDAEQRLKAGKLKALVATASLELGIDIGDVDLVIQVGVTPSIATFLQRVGRAGHALSRTPKGRIFPLTQDELLCAAALLAAVKRGDLDRTPQPGKPIDVLAQQIVAACVSETWAEDALFAALKRAWPYRELTREEFDAAVALHTEGRHALLHRDGVGGKLRATKRARIPAVTSGGTIPDQGDYQVLLEPEGSLVGSVNEDFAIESNAGDIFQLGNASWQILRVEPGVVRVADARGAPPTLPFWTGEAPARTRELSAEIGRLREGCDGPDWVERQAGVPRAASQQIADYVAAGRQALGTVPTQTRVVAERFFDESGGMQLVVHAPFGGRINRAWGLALRKRFCRGFGFELQAAANEEAFVLSLGPMHSFQLDEIFDYLQPETARHVLEQAVLGAPMFETRWRHNATRALLVPRMRNGQRVPTPLQRFRANDLLAAAFPHVLACPENLPGGDTEIPAHPIVRQTIEDCLSEAMDVEGLLDVLRGLRDGTIERVAVDTPEPSAFARGILNALPYAFLDDAPLEERRTQAVMTRRGLDVKRADEIGALDPEAVERVRQEAWPQPSSAEELHEALLWMGFATPGEAAASGWLDWLGELAAARRALCVAANGEERWFAAEASREPKDVLRGRLEALGPIVSEDPTLLALEAEGTAMRARLSGQQVWCNRRLLARIHRYTVERLRREIEPVHAQDLLRFYAAWQHVEETTRLHGPNGVREVVAQLQGFEAPAAAWESQILPARVRGYRREWIDECTLSGEVVWGRLWGSSTASVRTTPICLLRRADLDGWLALAEPADTLNLPGAAHALLQALLRRGALFPQELQRAAQVPLPLELEQGLAALVGRGLVTCDSYGGLRSLIVPPSLRRQPIVTVGRWGLFRWREPGDLFTPASGAAQGASAVPVPPPASLVESVARQLLVRWGIVLRRLLAREKLPVPWRDLLRCYRLLEMRGDVRGGRFVHGFDGEQFALPQAIELVRRLRRDKRDAPPLQVTAADPLNLRGILTPQERVSPLRRMRVSVG